jgi:hypothetical protein
MADDAPLPEARPAPLAVIACGAVAREVLALKRLNGWDHMEVRALPAQLHNQPQDIPEAVRLAVRAAHAGGARVFVAYADCGTGGMLDRVLADEGVARIPGAHCYQFYSGASEFAARAEDDMRAFFLTDFLTRHFKSLVLEGLGLDRHPELRDSYFGHYDKVVYLAQTDDSVLRAAAMEAAARLGLPLVVRLVGYGDLERAIRSAADPAALPATAEAR